MSCNLQICVGYNTYRGDFTDEKDFALRLSILRTKAGVSARDMSLSIGQNPGYINDIENGKGTPSRAGIFYICEYLNLTPSEFFDISSNNPAKLKPLIEKLKCLNDEQLASITNIVNDLVKLND